MIRLAVILPVLVIAAVAIVSLLLAGCASPPWYDPDADPTPDEPTIERARELVTSHAIGDWCASGTLKDDWFTAMGCAP